MICLWTFLFFFNYEEGCSKYIINKFPMYIIGTHECTAIQTNLFLYIMSFFNVYFVLFYSYTRIRILFIRVNFIYRFYFTSSFFFPLESESSSSESILFTSSESIFFPGFPLSPLLYFLLSDSFLTPGIPLV